MENITSKHSALTEENIIQKILQGEIALFEILIRRYNGLLYKIARSYRFNHQDAEDLMQDTYYTAYTQLKTLESPNYFKGWITKILIHKCLYKLNYGYCKNEQPNSEVITEKTSPVFNTSDNMSTGKTVINKELSKVLEYALQQISPTYRIVFVLREVEGYSVAETAEILNITPINVKVRLNRAKALLQNQIEQFYAHTDIFELNLIYCDNIVKKVFEKLNQ